MLKSKPKNFAKAFDLLVSMPEDFMIEDTGDTKAQNDATKSRIITPVEQSWDDRFESEGVSNDFMRDRQQELDSTRRG